MITKETQKEIDKMLIKEIQTANKKVADTLKSVKAQMMMDFDRDRVIDAFYPLQGDLLDLSEKIDRYAKRIKRNG